MKSTLDRRSETAVIEINWRSQKVSMEDNNEYDTQIKRPIDIKLKDVKIPF